MFGTDVGRLPHRPALRQLAACCLLAAADGRAWAVDEPSVWHDPGAVWTQIMTHGQLEVYLSGYAYHSRSTYSDARRERLNERAWGGGVGKTWRDGAGNDASLYAMAIRDSKFHPQWMAGYAYQWQTPATAGGLELGAGLTALIMRRSDWFGGVPFPAVLPVASLGTRRAKLTLTFIPHIVSAKGRGNGNVLLLCAKFDLD